MQLTDPPIGLAAVERFYNPRELTEYAVKCGARVFHITSHVKAAPNIQTFFAEINARKLDNLIHSYDGCFVDRPKRLSNQLSMHGRGAAIDLNAASNPQGGTPTMPLAIVHLARQLGFFWGGDFAGKYVDGMHFQLGVDFPLGARPVPSVTYKPEASGLETPPAAPNPFHIAGAGPINELKVFDKAGNAVPHAVEVSGPVLLVRLQ